MNVQSVPVCTAFIVLIALFWYNEEMARRDAAPAGEEEK
jgi:hypothetical protein